ncbi:hypothetical protein Tco_0421794 [Tanacetum coccineum]
MGLGGCGIAKLAPLSSKALENTTQARDTSVPSAGQASTMPTEGEKNTQATISQLFQKATERQSSNPQPNVTTTTPPPIPPIITSLPKSSTQTEGEHTKRDKGKKIMSPKVTKEENSNSGSDNDETDEVPGQMTRSSKEKAKAKEAAQEKEARRAELINLLGQEVVEQCYKNKIKHDKYCDKMLNRRATLRITNCDIRTRKGPMALKVYREDDKSEIITDFRANNLHLIEWREVIIDSELGINLDIPLSQQNPLLKLNDLVNRKRKNADEFHDFFGATKRLKSSVPYEDHIIQQDFITIEDYKNLPDTMLYFVLGIFFRLHQGPGLDDYTRSFSTLLLAKADKRNLNPLKQMRTIKQLRQ